MTKLFKSPDNEVRRVCCPTGHVFRIENNWVQLPEFAWKLAYAEGCISNDMVAAQEVVEDKSKLDRVVIKDFLKSAMTDNTEVFHPKTNKPLVGKVRKHIPSDVLVNEFIVKDIWDDILKELEDDS